MRTRQKVKDDELGPVGTVIFGLLLVVGPVYALLGNFIWVLLGVAATASLLAGINWLFTRFR